jgi:uncharacterized protein DUF6682
MAFTYQSVIDLARIPLNDSDKTRYSDADLLSYTNHCLLTLTKRRPDLFIGQYASLPDGQKALADTFPLGAEYVQTTADYVSGRSQMIDDENADSGKAALFVQLFGAEAPI